MHSFPNLEPIHCSMFSSNLLFDLHTNLSGGRWDVLTFPSLEEFSTVCCDPHSQRLWHSQESRNRCFSGTLLFFWWSSECWQFDLWLLCLSKTNLNIWKFTVHILLKTGLENFERYITSVWDECNCAIVWAFFSIAFLWDWNENWPFPVLWPLQRLGYIKTMTSILFSPPAPNSEGSKLQDTMLWITLGDRNLWPTGSKELSPPETTGLSLNTHSPAQSRLNMTAAPDNSLTTDSARTTPISGS